MCEWTEMDDRCPLTLCRFGHLVNEQTAHKEDLHRIYTICGEPVFIYTNRIISSKKLVSSQVLLAPD
jgi:hypothetical protein